MLGSLKKQIDEYYWGYREVRAFNMNEYELPNPNLLRYLTSGNKKKAQEHINEIFEHRAQIATKVQAIVNNKASVSGKPLNSEFEDTFLDDFFSQINSDGKNALDGNEYEMRLSINLGWALGRLDENNLKKIPPVALGIHIECTKLLNNEFPEEIQWATNYCLNQIFFLTRAGLI